LKAELVVSRTGWPASASTPERFFALRLEVDRARDFAEHGSLRSKRVRRLSRFHTGGTTRLRLRRFAIGRTITLPGSGGGGPDVFRADGPVAVAEESMDTSR
jgi:hypothetical protein